MLWYGDTERECEQRGHMESWELELPATYVMWVPNCGLDKIRAGTARSPWTRVLPHARAVYPARWHAATAAIIPIGGGDSWRNDGGRLMLLYGRLIYPPKWNIHHACRNNLSPLLDVPPWCFGPSPI